MSHNGPLTTRRSLLCVLLGCRVTEIPGDCVDCGRHHHFTGPSRRRWF